jgi:hypothetical protein
MLLRDCCLCFWRFCSVPIPWHMFMFIKRLFREIDLNGYSVTRVLDNDISCLKTQFVFNRNVKLSPRSGFILVFRNILARVPSLAFQTFHSDMLLIYGFTNGRPWTSATQNKCESYIYICRLLYRWYNIMYRLGWFHQQSPIFSWFGRTYVFEHFFDPAPFGRTHGCIGCTGWATQACSGEIGGIEVSTLRIFTNDENPIESVFPLLQEDHIAVKCPLKMWLH